MTTGKRTKLALERTAAIVAVMLFSLLYITRAHARLAGKYSTTRPLVVACNWDFPPYEYSNYDGKADGLNVDIIRTILTQMHIPHKFVMVERSKTIEMFEKGEADIIFAPVYNFKTQEYYVSKNVLCYSSLKVASLPSMPPLDLSSDTIDGSRIVLKSGDNMTRRTIGYKNSTLKPQFDSEKDALTGILEGKFDYFIWREEQLKWALKHLNLNGIELQDFDSPAVETHFVGTDRELIEELDDQYARMEQNGQLEIITDKWFHPDKHHDDTSPIAIYITIGVLAFVLVFLLLLRLIYSRVKAVTRRNNELKNILLQALSASHIGVVEYDIKKDLARNRHFKVLPEKGTTLEELTGHIEEEDQPLFRKQIDDVAKGTLKSAELTIRWHCYDCDDLVAEDEKSQLQYVKGYAFAEYDDDGKPEFIIVTINNVTQERRQEATINKTGSAYNRMFDTSLIAMSFYGKDGMLIDANRKMSELCQFDQEGEKFFRQTNLFDIPYFQGIFDEQRRDVLNVCQHMYYPEANLDKYVEIRILPVLDDLGDINYYSIMARDITAERNLQLQLKEHDRQLHKTAEETGSYEKQLFYLLENSDMWVWSSNLKERTASFSRSLKKNDFKLSFEQYIDNIAPEDKERVMKAFGNMNGIDENLNLIIKFQRTPLSEGIQWHAVSGIPMYDDEGRLTGHFGVVRNVTQLMLIQEKLKNETARADQSGKLKSVFLANMTHEIRTPLNAIVGFSDLLQLIEDPKERMEFIRIIRNNCDMLLRLINDIIEASNINQGPIAIEEDEVDFAATFNDICQTLAQRVQEPGVEFLVDNPYETFRTTLDKGRLQQVITNFTTNAVKYTHQGHIKVGFHEKQDTRSDDNTVADGIYMYCEDTGAGIPKDKQTSVFERFVKLNDYVQGTGLGLSICKSIADRYGGRIGVDSEGDGKGSNFWIWIPCSCTEKKMNSDNNAD